MDFVGFMPPIAEQPRENPYSAPHACHHIRVLLVSRQTAGPLAVRATGLKQQTYV